MTDQRDTTERRRRWPVVVALIVAVAAAGWTALWTVVRSRVAGEIDARLAAAQSHGLAIACADRAIGGFPFAMEISCREPGVSVAATGARVSAATLTVAVRVWSPMRVVAEVGGPVTARTAEGVEIGGTWRRLQAAVRLGGGGLDEVTIAGEGVALTATPAAGAVATLTAEHLDGSGRAGGATGRDLELRLAAGAAAVRVGDKRLGPPRSDLSMATTLVAALPPVADDPVRGFAARGGRIEPIRLDWSTGGIAVRGKGALTLGTDGVLDGAIGFAATGLEGLVGAGATLGAETSGLLGSFLLLGKRSNDADLPGQRLDLFVERGRPRFGRVVMPALPPLFRP